MLTKKSLINQSEDKYSLPPNTVRTKLVTLSCRIRLISGTLLFSNIQIVEHTIQNTLNTKKTKIFNNKNSKHFCLTHAAGSVSYTHLDVYKRQVHDARK